MRDIGADHIVSSRAGGTRGWVYNGPVRIAALLFTSMIILLEPSLRPITPVLASRPLSFTTLSRPKPRLPVASISMRRAIESFSHRVGHKGISVSSRHTGVPERVSHSVTELQKLQIPFSSFPSNAIQKTGNALPGASVDNPKKGVLFSDNLFHRQAYGTHGVLGAYDQSAQINFGTYDNYVSVEWLGSYYSSAQFATSRVDDATNTLAAQGIRGQSCYISDEPNCHLFIWDVFGNYFVFAIWSNDNAVGELALLSSPRRSPIPNQVPLGQDFQSLLKSGDSALIAAGAGGARPAPETGPPPAPAILIDKLNLLHIVRGRYKSTRAIHVNETASFLAYFHMSSAGIFEASGRFTFYAPKATLSMTVGGRSIFQGKPSMEVTSAGSFYFDEDGTFTDASAVGTVSAQFNVTLGSSKDSKTLNLTVTGPLGPALRR